MSSRPLQNRLGPAFRVGLIAFVITAAASLSCILPPRLVLLPLCGAAFLWWLFHHPVDSLGMLLAIMPFHFLAVMLGKFYGLPNMTLISLCSKEILFALLICVLGYRNGFKATVPDWFLLAFLTLALLRAAFGGTHLGLVDDLEFVAAYVAGRVTVLTVSQERSWAKHAVWIASALSVMGAIEVLILGDAPRKLLYLEVSDELYLNDPFHAAGFEGLRAASTMVGPLEFAALCMVALVIWWVYLRNPIPAALVSIGLVCALTRSAWLGTFFAISLLAFRMGQAKRLITYTLLVGVAFVAAIPALGIGDYISAFRSGQDSSQQGHRASLLVGAEYVVEHPLGTGPGSVGSRAAQQDLAGLNIESSYLTLAANYGLLAGLCFAGFFLSALAIAWRSKTEVGLTAAAVLLGFGTMMFVLPMHQDFRLACWVWFPVGLVLRQAQVHANG